MSIVLGSLGRDLRFALRGLARRPSFTVAAVLTLALGIGATTAIFSVVYSVLIKPLPYPNSDELVSIEATAPGVNIDDLASDQTMLLAYRDEGRTFASLGLWDQRSATLTERGEAARVPILRVADGTLQTLGVQPLHGRRVARHRRLRERRALRQRDRRVRAGCTRLQRPEPGRKHVHRPRAYSVRPGPRHRGARDLSDARALQRVHRR